MNTIPTYPGMRTMEERRLNLQAFKDGEIRILICTDVAARGTSTMISLSHDHFLYDVPITWSLSRLWFLECPPSAGIDIEGLPYVINLCLPDEPGRYILYMLLYRLWSMLSSSIYHNHRP